MVRELQRQVRDFVAAYDLQTNLQSRLLDWVSEVGEVAKEALKGTQYGSVSFRPTEGWEGELGDAFFSLICVANATGVDLDTALDRALEKYRSRLESRQIGRAHV